MLASVLLMFDATAQETQTSGQGFSDFFQSGVNSYRTAKYQDAQIAFTKALELNPDSVQALTNLGLTEFQLGKKAFAVALLRKAHNLDPSFSTPKSSLAFILPQLDVKEIPHEIQIWETLRADFLVPFSLTGFLAITALCFFSLGWVSLSFFGKRKRALQSGDNPPPFPVVLGIIFILFISLATITSLKVVDQQIPRGTVIADKTTVFSAPSDQAVSLYDLFGGLEVIIHQTNNDWIQVTYPGANTGWILKSHLFQTSGGKQ